MAHVPAVHTGATSISETPGAVSFADLHPMAPVLRVRIGSTNTDMARTSAFFVARPQVAHAHPVHTDDMKSKNLATYQPKANKAVQPTAGAAVLSMPSLTPTRHPRSTLAPAPAVG
jgi:hypothetical protein